MDCEYWKEIVRQLRNPSQCNWASHVLSSGLREPSDSESSNLAQALRCVDEADLIEAAIYAYRDSSSQPYCDSILASFDAEEILSVFLKMESPDQSMKVGTLSVLQDKDKRVAVKLASLLNEPL
jgi:hypothetical protein